MVFSLLGEKFNGPLQALSLLDGVVKPLIGAVYIQQVGLPAQLGRGMGVRIGNELQAVQGGQHPIHGRIRGKPRLHRMDVRGQFLKAFLQGIKAGKGSEQGKMRGPDMGRHEHGLRTGLQGQFQQIMAGQAQNGPPVGVDVADGLQPPGQLLRLLQPRQQDQAVDLPGLSVLLVNGADLPGDHKSGLLLSRNLPAGDPVLFFQPVQPLLRRLQLFFQFLPPGGMGKISRSQVTDALPCRLIGQHLRISVFAGGPGETGMYVQIRNFRVFHESRLLSSADVFIIRLL